MMMRPDDFEKLLFIAKLFLVAGITMYALKCGNATYHLMAESVY